MIGTIIPKPVDQEQFHAAMRWCCDKKNGARLMEYHDRYEVAARPAEEPQPEVEYGEPVSAEERMEILENAVLDLAARFAEAQ